MKRFIVDYILPSGSYCKGLIENDEELGRAYDEGTVDSDDIYAFLDECREILLEKCIDNPSQSEQTMPEGDTSPRT